MDDKTAELRDIFLDVSGEQTVTESQEASRGSLVEESPVDERLRSVVIEMRERYDFQSAYDVDRLVEIIQAFYAGMDDTEIAKTIDGATPETVRQARLDLQLLREDDFDASVDLNSLRGLLADGLSPEAAADRLESDVEPADVKQAAAVLKARESSRAVGDRYREEFEAILMDRELSDRLAASVREDGLEDATDGMETNVSF